MTRFTTFLHLSANPYFLMMMGLYIYCLLILIVASLTSGFEHNSLNGISHETQVVSDLQLSTRYYTQILGGKLVPQLSTTENGIYGDEHFYRFFYKEYSQSIKDNIPLYQLDVPDIRSDGDHNVRWNFIMFNNLMVQLLQFVDRYSLQPYIRKDPKVGNAFVTSTHVAFVADQSIIALQQVQDFIKKFADFPEMDQSKKTFISSNTVNSFKERSSQPVDTFTQAFSDAVQLATTRGPDGERFEILYRRGNATENDLQEGCRYKGVSHEMLDTRTKNKYHDSLSKRMAGFNHLSVVVDDMRKTDEFYIDILGGRKNVAESAPAAFPLDDFMRNVVFQDEILEALALGVPPDESFGIPNLNYTTKPLFDYTFIQFDNTYLEPYQFQVNDIPSNTNILIQKYRDWTSPAYINNNHFAFQLKDDINMRTFVKNVETRTSNRKLTKVFFNQASADSNINVYESPFNGSDLEGFNYLYFKGPSGEQMALSQFKGKAKVALQAAMEEYGALSTAFESTNPWNWGGFRTTCARLLN